MGRTKELLYAAEGPTPEEQANAQKARADKSEECLRQEREWATRYPREWAEWNRVRLLFDDGPIDFGKLDSYQPYDFQRFLAEVGKARSAKHVIKRKVKTLPFREGNLEWAERRPRRASPDAPGVIEAMNDGFQRVAQAICPPEPDIVDSRYIAAKLGLKSTQRVTQMVKEKVIPKDCIVPGSGGGKLWKFYREKIDKWLKNRN